ncbi:MAG: glutamate racemase [Puniceicoccales bacterium]|jgi:glutamate racemase|nr:glutamate racemase [Puniceicoccales bacterium]
MTTETNKRGAIGMFDSGVGGMSVFEEVTALMPNESVVYFADTAHCPYGGRSDREVVGFCEEVSHFLTGLGCKLIVVACNTATAVAIDGLRQRFVGVPFVGMEPAVKPAVKESRSGVIGVLATTGTFRGRLFRETLARHAGSVRVIEADGAGLVELVEAGKGDSPEADALLRERLAPLLAAGIDSLVLGCTHYPFLSAAIRRVAGESVTLISTGKAVARRVQQLLLERGLAAEADTVATHWFYASAPSPVLEARAGATVRRGGEGREERGEGERKRPKGAALI